MWALRVLSLEGQTVANSTSYLLGKTVLVDLRCRIHLQLRWTTSPQVRIISRYHSKDSMPLPSRLQGQGNSVREISEQHNIHVCVREQAKQDWIWIVVFHMVLKKTATEAGGVGGMKGGSEGGKEGKRDWWVAHITCEHVWSLSDLILTETQPKASPAQDRLVQVAGYEIKHLLLSLSLYTHGCESEELWASVCTASRFVIVYSNLRCT